MRLKSRRITLPRSSNRLLTFEEVEKATEMWEAGASRADIAGELDLAIWVLDVRRSDQLKHLPKRQGYRGGKYRRDVDLDNPPAEVVAEIERRRLEVQRSWTEEVRVSRLSGVPSPIIPVADVRGAIRNR